MIAIHGGDLETIAALSGHRVSELLDFSANINPLGPPDGVVAALRAAAEDPRILIRYPDPLYRALREALAYHAGTDGVSIAIGNGSAALIDAAVRALRPRRCLLPVPAFSEYRKALGLNGIEIVPLALDPANGFHIDARLVERAVRAAGCDLCIFSNPHNPSGALLTAAESLELIERLADQACTVIVDEAFIDYALSSSVTVNAARMARAIVLRSLTKFYAIPGMRVGYAVSSSPVARAIEASLPSWPVGTLAAEAALAAVQDRAYAERSVVVNRAARERLTGDLRDLGISVFSAAANFVLADVASLAYDADALRERLIRNHGIVVRSCSDFDVLRAGAFVRLAVRSRTDNERLVAGLRAEDEP